MLIRYRTVVSQADTCLIFELRQQNGEPGAYATGTLGWLTLPIAHCVNASDGKNDYEVLMNRVLIDLKTRTENQRTLTGGASLPQLLVLACFIAATTLLAGCGSKEPSHATSPSQEIQQSAAGPWIKADPNPVPVSKDGAPASTQVSWNTGDGSLAEVYLAVRDEKGEKETLFGGAAPSGSQPAPYFKKGAVGKFRLYQGKEHAKVLKEVVVTTIDK